MMIDYEILNQLVVYNPINKKIRIGRNTDGGYVIVDGYDYDCLVSFGAGYDVSFDNDFMKRNPNIPGFVFDGTMDRPPELMEGIKYINRNVDFYNTEKELLKDYKNIFVKMDIEGDEWNWIRGFNDLSRVKQLVFEAHGLITETPYTGFTRGLDVMEFKTNMLETFKIINKTHHLVHIHQNNSAPCIVMSNGIGYPQVVELTFLRKDSLIDGVNVKSLPIEGLDFPSYSPNPNYFMNMVPFVFPDYSYLNLKIVTKK